MGLVDDIDSGQEQTIWSTQTNNDIYVPPPTAQTLLFSSDDNDDSVAGTGAQILRIRGLNDDYAEIEELLALNGQTQVETTNVFIAVNAIDVVRGGTTRKNQGLITAVQSGSGLIMGYMAALESTAHQCIYTIPCNMNAIVVKTQFFGSRDAANEDIELTAEGFAFVPQLNVERLVHRDVIDSDGGNTIDSDWPFSETIPSMTSLWVNARNDDENNGFCGFKMWLAIFPEVVDENGESA